MRNDALTVRILTPEGTLFEGAAEAVFLPGMKGAFEVLPGHAPLISTLDRGEIVLRPEKRFPILRGVVKVLADEITVCVEEK
ncbi:MAG: F0F1 ATP synthase subunit epsilon [Bacteroidales bacterium]|nr:F0F1 ATP synthase subunit epsilon [Bacteroidales bacterium]